MDCNAASGQVKVRTGTWTAERCCGL